MFEEYLLQSIAAFFGTLSFAYLFDVPKKHFLISGFIGMCGWWVYLIVVRYTDETVFATFIAAIFLSCTASVMAYIKKAPGTIFLICGIFTLVPGLTLYKMTYEFFLRDGNPALAAVVVLKISLAIAFGIVIANTLMNAFFKQYHKWQHRHKI